jgi:hypothetical protein
MQAGRDGGQADKYIGGQAGRQVEKAGNDMRLKVKQRQLKYLRILITNYCRRQERPD